MPKRPLNFCDDSDQYAGISDGLLDMGITCDDCELVELDLLDKERITQENRMADEAEYKRVKKNKTCTPAKTNR